MKSVLALTLLASLTPAVRILAAGDTPCCGEITPEGRRLAKVFDSMHVESLWLAHEHVNWETGRPDKDADYEGPGKSTHCSAFAASVGKRLGAYMLRPPEHGQILLASAQAKWFSSPKGQAAGWQEVPSARKAQRLANQGNLVVVVFDNPNAHKPGHIAIVRPSGKTLTELRTEGPQVIQAGQHNYQSTSTQNGFRMHAGAWPDGVRYYAHPVSQNP